MCLSHVSIASYRRVSMLSNVHLSKWTGVSHTDHLHGEVSKEVDNLQRLSSQAEDEDNGSNDWTKQLLNNKHLHAKKERTAEHLLDKRYQNVHKN